MKNFNKITLFLIVLSFNISNAQNTEWKFVGSGRNGRSHYVGIHPGNGFIYNSSDMARSMLKSKDEGEYWERISNPATGTAFFVAGDPKNHNVIYWSNKNNGVEMSDNGDTSWSDISFCLPLTDIKQSRHLNGLETELETITQADLDMSINILRDRVAMPHMDINNIPVDPRYINDGVSPLIVEIRRERRVELCQEGHRYSDLMRWKQGQKLRKPSMGIQWNDAAIARYPDATPHSSVDLESGKTYIDVYKNSDYANPVFDENRHYLWPIPLNVISQNTNIEQNPGW